MLVSEHTEVSMHQNIIQDTTERADDFSVQGWQAYTSVQMLLTVKTYVRTFNYICIYMHILLNAYLYVCALLHVQKYQWTFTKAQTVTFEQDMNTMEDSNGQWRSYEGEFKFYGAEC